MRLPTPSPNGTVRVAAIQAQAEEFQTDADFERKVLQLVEDAAGQGAKIVVFPEDVGVWLELSRKSPRMLALRSIAAITSIANIAHGAIPNPAAPPGSPPSTAPQILSMPSHDELLSRFENWLTSLIHVPFFGKWLSQSGIDKVYRDTMSLAAEKYGMVIVGGSIYEVDANDGNIYVRCYVFDSDGTVAGQYDKHHLVTFEKCFGAAPSTAPVKPIQTKAGLIGACVCYDLNFGPTETDPAFQIGPVALELKNAGAQILCAGSTGIRPWPNYPYNPATDAPQTRRAQETGLAVVRAYQSGWLVPGIYMDGLSEIVRPDGSIDVCAYPDYQTVEKIFVADLPLA